MQNIKTFIKIFKYIMAIIGNKEKKRAVLIAFLSIFSALAETIGVSVILPFALAMLQPDMLMDYNVIKKLMRLLHISSPDEIVVAVGIGVIAVYILKNAFILSFNRYRYWYRNTLERDLSVKMFESYLYRPYSFFLNINSGTIMRGITEDNTAVALSVDAFSTLVNELLTCAMLGTALLLINPLLALGVMCLAGVIALLSVILLKRRIGEYSVNAREAFAERYKYSYEAVSGIKDIAVMKRQKEFIDRYKSAASVASENNVKYLWISMLPGKVTEAVFISGLIVIILVARTFNADMVSFAAQLSVLGLAAIRILPSISSISSAVNTLVYYRPGVESAYENIIEQKANDSYSVNRVLAGTNKMDFADKVVIDDIYWRYSDRLGDVLKGVSLEIFKGESVGLIGESGAGKTTLVDLILGLFTPQQGGIIVDGKSIFDPNVRWNSLVGYVPQSVFLMDDTIRNNILFGVAETDVDEDALCRAVEQAQLSGFINNLPDGINTILGERGVKISGGQRQRIAIARALYYDPEILVLDEATSALDNDTESAVMDAINTLQGQKTLIIVAHRLSTIEKCDKVYEIRDGKAYLKD